jgi:glycosyltransferase involved in cell wall biosynthesis
MATDILHDRFTVCIPTYNRKEVIARRVTHFCENYTAGGAQLLVSDNQSSDGTFQALQVFKKAKGLIVVQNSENGSHFFGNISNLFRACKSEWALFCSDEDWLPSGALDNLALELPPSSTPDIIIGSVSKLQSDLPGESRVMSGKPLLFREIANLTYMSGIVVNLPRMERIFNAMYELQKETDNSFLYYFPLTAMLWAAHARQGLRGMRNTLICRQERAKGFFPGSKKLVHFKTVDGRWKIWTGGKEWLNYLKEAAPEIGCDPRILGQMEEYHSNRLLRAIRLGISYESPSSIELLDKLIRIECATFLTKEV